MSALNVYLIIHNRYPDSIAEILRDRVVEILSKHGITIYLRRYDNKTLFEHKFLLEAVHLDVLSEYIEPEESKTNKLQKFYFCYSKNLDKLYDAEKKYGINMFYYAEDFNTYINQLQILLKIGSSISYLNNADLSDSLSDSTIRKNKAAQELKKLEREMLHGAYFGRIMEKKLNYLNSCQVEKIEDKFSELIVSLLSLSKTLYPVLRMETHEKYIKKFLADLILDPNIERSGAEIPETGNKKIDAYISVFNAICKL